MSGTQKTFAIASHRHFVVDNSFANAINKTAYISYTC